MSVTIRKTSRNKYYIYNMADKKISQLTTLSELSGDEQIPVAKDGANYKVSVEDLQKKISVGGGGGTPSTPIQTKDIADGAVTDIKIDEAYRQKIANAVEVSYSALKDMRDNGELVAGQFYRITDYVTTTAQAETQSAGHAFDVVVVALDSHTLSETANAVQHNGDSYFNGCKLSAWELKYCLDNDTTRFAWADTENGKGVIYYMKDEYNNESPYDFKNIQFRRVDANTITIIRGEYYNDNSAKVESFFNSTKNTIPFKYQYLQWYDSIQAAQEGFADLLGMTEEEIKSSGLFYCILDDKGWIGDPGLLASVASITDDNSKWLFTFNSVTFTDSSLDGYINRVFSNKIGVCQSEGVIYLNNICFFGNNCSFNTFGNNCSFNTFGNYFSSNTFGNGFSFNTFGNICGSNTFGNDCSSNTFGNNCSFNTFGNNCPFNTFGNYFSSNTFGNDCGGNTFESLGNGVKLNYIRYFIIQNGASDVKLQYNGTPSNTRPLKNVIIKSGVTFDEPTIVSVDAATFPLNAGYQWTIAKNSKGEIVQYSEADIIQQQ